MAPRKGSPKDAKRAGTAAPAARARGATKAAAEYDPEVARLRELLELMKEYGLAELEIGADGHSVRLSKTGAAHGAAIGSPAPAAFAASNPAAASAASLTPHMGVPAPAGKPPVVGEPFLSPMVGTFYRAASPEANPFVMEGDVVKPDAVLCIIEAMKVMNEIKAERPGKVVQVLVENGEAVEYGQPLFLIQRMG